MESNPHLNIDTLRVNFTIEYFIDYNAALTNGAPGCPELGYQFDDWHAFRKSP